LIYQELVTAKEEKETSYYKKVKEMIYVNDDIPIEYKKSAFEFFSGNSFLEIC